jgi:predicted nucleic acid-binding protein
MNGIKYLLDTNIVIGMYQRHALVLEIVHSKRIAINECAYSSITRMELLSFPNITDAEEQAIKTLLLLMTNCSISPIIEDIAIDFRRRHHTKLPDSIIAATAKAHQVELLTLDKNLANKL